MEFDVLEKPKCAFAVLLTADSYAVGVQVLAWSLRSVGSNYPLVVLYTPDTLSPNHVQELQKLGCDMRRTKRIILPQEANFALSYYSECWTKLKFFGLVEFERLVVLDADMLVMKNLDELMTMVIPDGWIAASPGCKCNPLKKSTYPSDWNPSVCPYSNYKGQERNTCPPMLNQASSDLDYFNAGLIVLKPSLDDMDDMINTLFQLPCLTQYRFAEQDFLNQVYKGKWIALSYQYNALKTFRSCHSEMWDDNEIKITHYIFDKPWKDMGWPKKSEAEKRKDPFYHVNTWWFRAYIAMTMEKIH